MATVIDALVVTLGLDGRGFAAGQRSASKAMRDTSVEATKSAKEIEARGKQAAAFFSKLRNEALALVAVFTAGAGIKNFVENTIGGAASLGLMAKNLDMSTQSLDAWQKANRRTGGTAEGMAAQLKESASELANIKMGRSSEAATEFYRMGGIDARNFKDGNEFLLARSRILADLYKQDPTRAMVVAGRMGISEDTFNLLKQGPEAVMALVDAQRKNSQVTEEQAAAALKLRNAWLDFTDRINTVTTQTLLRLEPALQRVMNKLQQLAEWVATHQDDIGRWVTTAADAIERFAKGADSAAQSVGGWRNVLAGLLALKLVSFTAGLLSLAGALTGVSVGFGAIAAAGPAGLAVLAAAAGGVAGYKGAEAFDKATRDTGPIKPTDKIEHTDPNATPGVKELALRTAASLGNAGAAKSLYKMTGRNDYPASWTPEGGATVRPPERYKQGEGGMSEIIDRTLASLGNKSAARRIRDATGVDSYLVGPDPVDEAPATPRKKTSPTLFLDLESQYKLPSGLLDRMWKQESGRGKYMLSPAGAKGHFGFMDDTAKEYGLQDPNDLGESATAAARMMADLMKRNGGDLDRALAAYNWGQGNLNRKGFENRPAETRDYVRKVNPDSPKRDAVQQPDTRQYLRSVSPTSTPPAKPSNTSTTEVNINGPISITAPSGDVSSIAGGLADALRAQLMAAQSNTGLD